MQCSPMTCILFSGCGDAIKPETAPISRKPVVTHPSVERSRKRHDWFSLQFWGDGVRRHQQRSPWLPGQYTSTDNSAVAAGELFTNGIGTFAVTLILRKLRSLIREGGIDSARTPTAGCRPLRYANALRAEAINADRAMKINFRKIFLDSVWPYLCKRVPGGATADLRRG